MKPSTDISRCVLLMLLNGSKAAKVTLEVLMSLNFLGMAKATLRAFEMVLEAIYVGLS